MALILEQFLPLKNVKTSRRSLFCSHLLTIDGIGSFHFYRFCESIFGSGFLGNHFLSIFITILDLVSTPDNLDRMLSKFEV